MAERSVQVENRVRNGEAVVASGRTHRDGIASLVAEQLEGLSPSDVQKLIGSLCSALESRSDALGAAEDRNVAEVADDMPLRTRRDAAVTELISRYDSVRSRMDSALGSRGLRRYGLESPATRTPHRLVNQTKNVIQLLRKEPTDIDDGIASVSTEKIADVLAAAVAPLEEVTKALIIEGRENEAALTDRNRAVENWTVMYQSVANMLSALYTVAGRVDLAERIRPTVRRAEGLEEPTPEPEPATDGGEAAPGPSAAAS